jgi:hypothetical protein
MAFPMLSLSHRPYTAGLMALLSSAYLGSASAGFWLWAGPCTSLLTGKDKALLVRQEHTAGLLFKPLAGAIRSQKKHKLTVADHKWVPKQERPREATLEDQLCGARGPPQAAPSQRDREAPLD